MEIIKFNPSIAHLKSLAEKYKGLEIQGASDKIGYSAVDIARKDLKANRVKVTNTGKEMRAEAIQFQKKVISLEKEAIAIIEPLEKELALKQVRIDNIKELPERIEKLKDIKVVSDKEMLIGMDNRTFTSYYKKERENYYDDIERIEEERKRRIEEDKRIEEAKKQAKIDAENEVKLETIKKEEEEKQKEEARQANQKYQDWLNTNDFCGEDNQMILKETDDKIIMYKVVSTFKK